MVSGERLGQRVLVERDRAAGGLGLELGHRLNHLHRAGCIPEPPTRHRVGLGGAVERDRLGIGVLVYGGVAKDFMPRKDELIVDFIR